jgi:hypothetical protein
MSQRSNPFTGDENSAGGLNPPHYRNGIEAAGGTVPWNSARRGTAPIHRVSAGHGVTTGRFLPPHGRILVVGGTLTNPQGMPDGVRMSVELYDPAPASPRSPIRSPRATAGPSLPGSPLAISWWRVERRLPPVHIPRAASQ